MKLLFVILAAVSTQAHAMSEAFHERMERQEQNRRIVKEGFVCPNMFSETEKKFLNGYYDQDAREFGVTQDVLKRFAACMRIRFNPHEINLATFDQILGERCKTNLGFYSCFQSSVETARQIPLAP